jgi:hypothetical protein
MGLDHGLESEARLLYAWRKTGDLSVAEIKAFTPPNVDTDEHVIPDPLHWRPWQTLCSTALSLPARQISHLHDFGAGALCFTATE